MSFSSSSESSVELHDRKYKLPRNPTVIVCVDGFDPEYLQQGCKDNILPNMHRWMQSGFHTTGRCAMPSLTNPNNCSIITGVPTSTHGIAGNSYIDRATGEERMVLDDSQLRGSTILEQMEHAGVRVAVVTAKEKLRRIIGHGLSPETKGAICFSTQDVKSCTKLEHGIENVEQWLQRPAPAQYSGDLSIYVLDAGIELVRENQADLFYLTLSDYVQHKYAPGSLESNEFMHALDLRLGKLEELGATVAVTGDHGMSDKCHEDDQPNVLFLEDELNLKWPESGPKVLCPIADPFVRHHGALGSFVRVHLRGRTDCVMEIVQYVQSLAQVEVAYEGQEAAALYEMPSDREGDLVVISKKNAVIGSRKDDHDLSQLDGFRLRSHGGLSEQMVPLIKSKPLHCQGLTPPNMWRNFDIFDLALNW